MKIAQMNPKVTPWKNGQRRPVGNWSFVDTEDSERDCQLRQVIHYSTVMVEFFRDEVDDNEWHVGYTNVGIGSVRDQGGVNQLLRSYGYYYSRHGGTAQIINNRGDVVASY